MKFQVSQKSSRLITGTGGLETAVLKGLDVSLPHGRLLVALLSFEENYIALLKTIR
jgi:hypothetical protein